MTTTMHDKTLNNSIDSSLNNVHFRNTQFDESNKKLQAFSKATLLKMFINQIQLGLVRDIAWKEISSGDDGRVCWIQ